MAPTPRTTRSRPGSRQGMTVLEIALILPILVPLMLVTLEVANILRTQITLDSAATTVARQVAVDPNVRTQAAAEAYLEAQNLLPKVTQTYIGATAPVLTLTPENPTCSLSATCNPFELKIVYNYHTVSGALMDPFFDGITLAASVKKTVEPGTGTSLVTE
jgi:Flp pilus assembly protein TadG